MKSVLKQDARFHYKSDEALKYCKHLASVFKTEERRRVHSDKYIIIIILINIFACMHGCIIMQVLGIPPSQKASHLTTKQLAKVMIDYLKAPQEKLDIYIRHLMLLVRVKDE